MEGDALLGGGSLCVGLFSGVESIDISLVMLLVVKLHDLTGDEGLESVIRVREVGKSVLARHSDCDVERMNGRWD